MGIVYENNDPRPLCFPVKRINQLIQDTLRAPFEGIGKPEPLKGDLSGYWSRRINDEHRLVYTVKADNLLIIASRYHYGQ